MSIARLLVCPTHLSPLINLILNPVPKLDIIPVQKRGPFQEREQPRKMGEEGNVEHISSDSLEYI